MIWNYWIHPATSGNNFLGSCPLRRFDRPLQVAGHYGGRIIRSENGEPAYNVGILNALTIEAVANTAPQCWDTKICRGCVVRSSVAAHQMLMEISRLNGHGPI